jgi:hypothetical protein
MPYVAEIKRTNPSCFIFLVDQSGSMNESYNNGTSKASAVADILNRLLSNLVIKCARSEAVWDYYSVAVIGYGSRTGPAFSGTLSGQELVPISAISDAPARIEDRAKKVSDGAGGLVDQTVKFPVWFEPVANGGTPMADAMRQAQSMLKNWIAQYPDCFPPIVINVTDGEADNDPSREADAIRALSTTDGNVLLFNVHISGSPGRAIEYPDDERGLADKYARDLFRMSSVLPDYMRELVEREGIAVSPNTRGFAFNADLTSTIRFLDIGTRPENLSLR